MKLNVWLGIGTLMFLAGCGAMVSYTPYDLREPSRVVKNPADVLIISDATTITRPYKEIGILQVEGEYGNSSSYLEELRKEAAKRGADAIINIQESTTNKTEWRNRGTFGGSYTYTHQGGFFNPGVPLILPQNIETLKIRGTAIIFL